MISYTVPRRSELNTGWRCDKKALGRCSEAPFKILYLLESKHHFTYNYTRIFMLTSHFDGEMLEEDPDQEDYDTEEYRESDEGKEETKVGSSGKWYDGIDGIDPGKGIENSGGEETYLTVVSTFYDSMEEDRDTLCAYFDSQDWKNYTVKAHALKSTALLIGAMELAEEARSLEMAGKGDDIGYIRENHAATMEHLMNFKKSLAKVFEDEGSGDDGFDDLLLGSIYDALREGAAKCDDELISETFDEASDYTFSNEDILKLSKLKELFEAHEYGKMTELLG